MKSTTNIENLNVTINIATNNSTTNESELANDSEKMELLVSTLRIIAEDPYFADKKLVIPDKCEKYGFSEGNFELPTMLQFFADMLQES